MSFSSSDIVQNASFNKENDSVQISSQASRNYGALENNFQFSSVTASNEKITLSWENIRAETESTRTISQTIRRSSNSPHVVKILKGVSGIAKPGSLLAIMGASGSGKTTLLNVLTSNTLSDIKLSGEVKVNGLEMGRQIKTISGYVQQDDLFIGVLTVWEHLWFQAMLRMSRNKSLEFRKKRVQQVIRELGLEKCKNSPIGIYGRVKSISGGERKRLAFGSEILNNPPMLFCDEPTSGLDSFMAESVVRTLGTMAQNGKTILCTIHQPSSQVFELFDNLLLMAEGQVAYIGPTVGAIDFFTHVGFSCPLQYNPADFFINTLAILPGREMECRKKIDEICECFEASGRNSVLKESIAQASRPGEEVKIVSPYKSTVWQQMTYLMWRSWVTSARDSSLMKIRFLQNLIVGILAGLLCAGRDNSQASVQNINGALWFSLIYATWSNGYSAANFFPAELALLKREHLSGMYRVWIYYLCKTLADLPVFIVISALFSTLLYWIVGFKTDAGAFFICIATLVLLTNVVLSFIYCVSVFAGDVSTAISVADPICMPFGVLGGFYVNQASIPVYFIWMEYLSWFRYANEILIVNQWHNFGNITCEYSGKSSNDSTSASACFENGEEVVANMNFSYDNMATDFLALTALLIGFKLLTYVFMRVRVRM